MLSNRDKNQISTKLASDIKTLIKVGLTKQESINFLSQEIGINSQTLEWYLNKNYKIVKYRSARKIMRTLEDVDYTYDSDMGDVVLQSVKYIKQHKLFGHKEV